MIRNIFLAFIVALAVTGCASPAKTMWAHATKSQQEFHADMNGCRQQALSFNPHVAPAGNAAAFGAFAGLYAAQAQANANLANVAAQIQMMETCMYSMGYYRVSAEK